MKQATRQRHQDVAFWLGTVGQLLLIITGQWGHALILGGINYLIIWNRP